MPNFILHKDSVRKMNIVMYQKLKVSIIKEFLNLQKIPLYLIKIFQLKAKFFSNYINICQTTLRLHFIKLDHFSLKIMKIKILSNKLRLILRKRSQTNLMFNNKEKKQNNWFVYLKVQLTKPGVILTANKSKLKVMMEKQLELIVIVIVLLIQK